MEEFDFMKMITFSINAYNVEKTIGKTIESLVSDSKCLDKIEIIIIDDGSTDGTNKVAQKYVKEYPDVIKLISKINGGLGSAMNCGMKNAEGKYFKSIDGDDWINTENLGDLINFLEVSQADMVVSDYIKFFSQTKRQAVHLFDVMQPQKEYNINQIISDLNILPYHTLFYKTSILRKWSISIDEKLYYVDTELELFPLYYVNTISYFDREIYIYRLGVEEQSVSVESLKKNILQLEQVYLNLEKFYINKRYLDDKENISNFVKKRVCRLFCLYIKVYVGLPINVRNYKELKSFIIRTKANKIYQSKDMHSITVRLIYKFPSLFYIPAAIFERIQDFKHEIKRNGK